MLHLASQSPRRRELLDQLGLRYGLLDVAVEEVRAVAEPPQSYVSRVAREKAGAGLLMLGGDANAVVLGADTEVVLADEVFGKPANAAEAGDMLRRLSGRAHQVISVVWAVNAGRESCRTQLSEVRFATLDEATIDAYCAGEEWRGKAGGYAIQGRAAAFIAELRGSYSGVMGLPLYETAELLHEFSIEIPFRGAV